MKIAFFSDNFYPELSGIADSIMTLGTEIAKRGHKVSYFVPKYSPQDYEVGRAGIDDPVKGENISVNRLFSVRYPTPTGQGRLVIPTFFTNKEIKIFDPDIIHTQLFFGAGLQALWASRYLKKPIIGTNHTAISEFARYAPLPIIGKFLEKYTIWYYNRCDFVTAPSDSVFSEMEPKGFKKPHKVISNPIDTFFFRPFPEDRRQALKKELGFLGKVVFFAGRLAPEKNIDVLIRAQYELIKRIPDALLVIAGHGIYANELKKLVKTLAIENSVKFLGNIPKAKMPELYAASDVFAIASTSETQSLTLMYALACGVPSVGVSARALPEYISEGIDGFIVPVGNHKEMAKKIFHLLADDNKRETFGKEARKFALRYSISSIANLWEEIYNKTAFNR